MNNIGSPTVNPKDGWILNIRTEDIRRSDDHDHGITMDSREIAVLTGKRHSTVLYDIEVQLGKLGGEQEFRSTYLDASNRMSKCYLLPYRETMILVSGYSVELRAPKPCP